MRQRLCQRQLPPLRRSPNQARSHSQQPRCRLLAATNQANLDDRSTAETLIDSFYNAINRREYGRAYGYWQTGAAGLPPYEAFAQGYTATSAVQVGYGVITGDTGAGQTRYSVPIRITAQTSGGGAVFRRLLHSASWQPRRAGDFAVPAVGDRVGNCATKRCASNRWCAPAGVRDARIARSTARR